VSQQDSRLRPKDSVIVRSQISVGQESDPAGFWCVGIGKEVELSVLQSLDVSEAVPAAAQLFQGDERFALILIRPQSFAPFVKSNYYFPRHGLCQEGAAVEWSHGISRIIALTAHRTYGSH
jgi:hypothetical protein